MQLTHPSCPQVLVSVGVQSFPGLLLEHCNVRLSMWVTVRLSGKPRYSYCLNTKRGRGAADVQVSPLTGISGLSFDSTLPSPVLVFWLILLLCPSLPFTAPLTAKSFFSDAFS